MPNLEMTEKLTASGEAPMTPAQASYLKTLCQRAGLEFNNDLSKKDASLRIDQLRDKLKS